MTRLEVIFKFVNLRQGAPLKQRRPTNCLCLALGVRAYATDTVAYTLRIGFGLRGVMDAHCHRHIDRSTVRIELD